jgi:hypothetical protein
MPRFSISGVLVTRDASDTVTAASPVTLNVVMPAGQMPFSHSILQTFADDIPEADITVDAAALGYARQRPLSAVTRR